MLIIQPIFKLQAHDKQNILMPITTKILEYKVQVQCYGVPPTQLAASFISHEYHYVGMTSVIVVMGLPQSDQIYTVYSLVIENLP